jgi:hypothetical protein
MMSKAELVQKVTDTAADWVAAEVLCDRPEIRNVQARVDQSREAFLAALRQLAKRVPE